MIVPGKKEDFTQIYEIINDAASAYKGIIPRDRWHEPYMSQTELQQQIDDGVQFWCYIDDNPINIPPVTTTSNPITIPPATVPLATTTSNPITVPPATPISGVMGIQDRGDVTLIRHAYVRTSARNKGIGGKLLQHLTNMTTKTILIGTWADATWAIEFYKKHGFRLVSFQEKELLLRKYWSIPLRQIETSVVLSNQIKNPRQIF